MSSELVVKLHRSTRTSEESNMHEAGLHFVINWHFMHLSRADGTFYFSSVPVHRISKRRQSLGFVFH